MTSSVWGNEKTEYFNVLTPDRVIEAVEILGLRATGRVMQLGSMENRVYQVEIENENAAHISENFKIIKFYRPGRWSKDQIQDEHDFLFDLILNDIDVIAPDKFQEQSVFTNSDGLLYCLFPKKGGRACDEWNDELLSQMGRLLARVHNIGLQKKSEHRLNLDIATFGETNLEMILKSKYMIPEYRSEYEKACLEIFKISRPFFKNINYQRIHVDCHHGNILVNNGPFLIDFDDMSMGPRVQDIWMIIPGRDEEAIRNRNILLDAYESMTEFNDRELLLIEPLRALRIIHFSAWIGHRFEDKAFQNIFTTFSTHQYWENEIHYLKDQINQINLNSNPSHWN